MHGPGVLRARHWVCVPELSHKHLASRGVEAACVSDRGRVVAAQWGIDGAGLGARSHGGADGQGGLDEEIPREHGYYEMKRPKKRD